VNLAFTLPGNKGIWTEGDDDMLYGNYGVEGMKKMDEKHGKHWVEVRHNFLSALSVVKERHKTSVGLT